MTDDVHVRDHYRRGDLQESLDEALRAAGADPGCPNRDDLAAFESFHVGGRAATQELADLAALEPDERVLDVGCGVGGPARTLAAEYDCEVIGVDLIDEYCVVAGELSTRVGLADRLSFLCGSATALPLSNGAFDVAWLQHAGMNISDTDVLVDELRGVLRPGGRLAIHEVCAVSGDDPLFPVPWAARLDESHLLAPDDLEAALESRGFARLAWEDVTDESLARVQTALNAREKYGRRAVGIDLLMGGTTDAKLQNLATNMAEGRISVMAGVFRRE